MTKIKLAVAAGSYCGGCDMSIVALNEMLIPLEDAIDLQFWQFAADFKLKDVEKLKDGEIDITLFDGPIRTSEHIKTAHLFRKKSKIMIAYGSCACFGGIPQLANSYSAKEILDENYVHGYNMDDSGQNHMQPTSEYKKGRKMTLPKLLDSCLPLDTEVEVDYFVPGCPPVPGQWETLLDIISKFIKTGELPPKGTVIAGNTALCEECGRTKPDEIVINKFVRPYEVDPDPEICLLAQGIICLGPATRSGCGAKCTLNANVPCRGCFGPAPEVNDAGIKMLSAIASIAGAKKEGELGEEGLKALMDQVVDPFGTFYRFAVPEIMKQMKMAKKQVKHVSSKSK
ncbi:MAG: oxidoreductase [Candidatus Heimdallarchaeota archaeon]|nr:MAG: oxidoreductase [Candidatus Gerdarchaeota archaeon]RLI73222.1 MAG: oxidoreductase [Candidatus Heimdallarchaeota archaeon]